MAAVGGITFSMPSIQNGQINGGYNFDLPMATIQSFMTDAYSFTSNNSTANRGFLDNVITKQQGAIAGSSEMVFKTQQGVMSLIERMNSGIEKLAGKAVDAKGSAITSMAGGYSARRHGEAAVLKAQADSIRINAISSLF